MTPAVQIVDIGEHEANVSWIPGSYDERANRPIGDRFMVRYREAGTKEWNEVWPDGGNMTVALTGLSPGTEYIIRAVSIHTTKDGKEMRAESKDTVIVTQGERKSAKRLSLSF